MRFKIVVACMTLLIATALAQSVRAADKDVFDYKAERDARRKRSGSCLSPRPEARTRGNHEFMAGSIYFARTINADYPNAYAVVYPQDHWPNDLSEADAIIVLLNHARQAALDPHIKAAVERGAGFMAIHFGVEVDAGEQGQELSGLDGRLFRNVLVRESNVDSEIDLIGKHPTTRGVHPFKIDDEWYYHMRFRDRMKGVTPILSAVPPASTVKYDGKATSHGGNADVLADVVAHKPQVLAWSYQRPDGGAGFGFTGFHRFSNLMNDDFRTTLLNGIAWVSHLEIPSDGVASTRPAKKSSID